MSYEPTNWQDGDIVTASKLNKMEQGITNNSGALLVTETITNTDSRVVHQLNTTWQEINDALSIGRNVNLIVYEEGTMTGYSLFPIIFALTESQSYIVGCVDYMSGDQSRIQVYGADVNSGYPVRTEQQQQD